MSEVRKKVQEALTGVVAERKAQEDAAEHRRLMAWNLAENRRLHELRCVGREAGRGPLADLREAGSPLSRGFLSLAGWQGCGRRRWNRSSGRRRSRPAGRWKNRPGCSASSRKCCNCRLVGGRGDGVRGGGDCGRLGTRVGR